MLYPPRRRRVWIAVVALGICAFSIVTSELAPVGMLNALAADFHQTESGVGLAVTAHGGAGAPGSSAFRRNAGAYSRKALLVGLMLIRVFLPRRNLVLFDVRPDERPQIGALAHGVFWP